MGSRVDYIRKKFAPMQEKNLKNALAHRIRTEFPRIGGPRISMLCAEMILEVVNDHVRPISAVSHGQVLWMAVSIDDPPKRYRRIVDTHLVPVVLDLSVADDIDARIAREKPETRLLAKALRLCRQAYEQGGLLSNCDLAELLTANDKRIATILVEHEKKTKKIVPRRATLHDVGTGLTHKRIIIRKRFADGKPADVVARETYHSLEAVDRYLSQYDRVRCCRLEGMSPLETARVLDCGVSLVEEYLAIDRELDGSTE